MSPAQFRHWKNSKLSEALFPLKPYKHVFISYFLLHAGIGIGYFSRKNMYWIILHIRNMYLGISCNYRAWNRNMWFVCSTENPLDSSVFNYDRCYLNIDMHAYELKVLYPGYTCTTYFYSLKSCQHSYKYIVLQTSKFR